LPTLEEHAFGPARPATTIDLDAAGDLPPRQRWLAGVCLGALGRYAAAARFLLPGGQPAGSLAASCAASHLRQRGRHADAEVLDRLALAGAATAEERADALVGLVADAVGTLDLAESRRRLAVASADLDGDRAWRAVVRLGWVRAEVALMGDDPLGAADWARISGRRSREVGAWRHAIRSDLVLGAALDAAGHRRAAVRVLGAVAARAERSGLIPLVPPARTIRAVILSPRSRTLGAREQQRVAWAESIIETPADSLSTR
jgi:hypothetical protein